MLVLSRSAGAVRAGVAVAVALVLVGCGSDADAGSSSGSPAGSVSAADLERRVERRLSKEVGVPIDADCDAGIKARSGALEYCSGTTERQPDLQQRIRVRVAGVEGDRAQLDVTIFRQIDPANAARSAQQGFVAAGERGAKVTCPGKTVHLEADASFTCTITGSKRGDTMIFTVGKDNEPASMKAKVS